MAKKCARPGCKNPVAQHGLCFDHAKQDRRETVAIGRMPFDQAYEKASEERAKALLKKNEGSK